MTGKASPDERLDKILKTVADRINVPVEAIKGRDRSQDAIQARMIYGWLACRTQVGSLGTISGHIGRRHTAGLYWREAIEDRRRTNLTLRALTDDLRKELTIEDRH